MNNYSERSTSICTWFYAESVNEESYYPQVGGRPSSPGFQAVYLRCVIVFFATSLKQNPHAEHTLFTNLKIIPDIGRFHTMDWLSSKGIRIETIPLTYKTPEGFHSEWRNQFYIFDILKHLAAQQDESRKYLILDSDCVWVRPVNNIIEEIEDHGLLSYSLGSRYNQYLPKHDLLNMYGELGVETGGQVPEYFGGEWLAASGQEVGRIVEQIDDVWDYALKRFADGKPKFYEEAFALSCIYYKLGYLPGTANGFVKRLWTTGSYGDVNISEQDLNLTIWHLPNEKKSGIRTLFYTVINSHSKFWLLPSDEKFVRFLGSYFGIPESNWKREIRGWTRRQQRRTEKGLRKLRLLLRLPSKYYANYTRGF